MSEHAEIEVSVVDTVIKPAIVEGKVAIEISGGTRLGHEFLCFPSPAAAKVFAHDLIRFVNSLPANPEGTDG